MDRIIPYGRQNIDENDIAAVVEALRDRLITQGPRVGQFENKVAAYCEARYAVAFNSGTAALHAAMFAAGVKPGDEVISSPVTFVATMNSALYLGARPIFVDMDRDTWCIDINKIAAAISPRTRVIIPVDYAGYPVDIRTISSLAPPGKITVIEDAAHALGAVRGGILTGGEADITMFSFHPVKHITTGEGGIIVTGRNELADRLRSFRSHGIVKDDRMQAANGPWYYEMQELGYNYRITDIQCALGISQLDKLEGFIHHRQIIAARYYDALKDIPWLTLPPAPDNGRHAYHLFPVLVAPGVDRRDFVCYMQDSGIGVQVHYIPVHLQPYYRSQFGFKPGDFPVAEDFYAREVSLPIYPGLTGEEQDYIISKVKTYINRPGTFTS